MAKKSRKNEKAESAERSLEYTTARGVTITLRGMPPLIPQQISNSVILPDPPTYDVETVNGVVEKWLHDETTLTTDEDKAAWAKYQEETTKAENLITERLLKAILIEAVEVQNYEKQFESWKKNQKLIGITLPEEEEELLLLFKENEVFRDIDSIEMVMNTVLELTGVSREDITKMKNSFPGDVESEPQADGGNSS